MQDVVEQSGLSPGSIYCHFAGKRDIIVAVVEERHRRERALLQRAFETQGFAEAVDQLTGDFIAALRAPEERAWRRLNVQLWAESLHDQRLAVAVRDKSPNLTDFGVASGSGSGIGCRMLMPPGFVRKTLGEMQSSRHLLPGLFLRMVRTRDDPAQRPHPCDTLRTGFFSVPPPCYIKPVRTPPSPHPP
jgi:AcrR family transcriptional regulator